MRGERRRMAIMLTVLGVLVVAFVGRALLSGGDDATPATEPAVARGAQTETTAATVPEVVLGPDDTFSVFASRNPFEPAIGGGLPTTPTTVDDFPSFPTTPTSFDPTTPTTPTSAPTFDPQRETVTLIDVFDANGTFRASVQVGATVYDVGVGETFAGRYRVVSLDATCGQFLFGDSPFRLCEGEQVVK